MRKGKRQRDNTNADTAISLSQCSLRSKEVHKALLQVQNMTTVNGKVMGTVCFPGENKIWQYTVKKKN